MGLRAGYGFNFSDSGGMVPGTTTFTGLTDTPDNIVADQFVVGNASGNRLVFSSVNPGADGASEFTELTDTPSDITSNQFIRGNSAGNALEFVAGRLISNAQNIKLNGIEEGAEVNVQANWDETDSNNDAFIQNKPTIPDPVTAVDTFTGLTDTPSSITADQFVQGNSDGDALEFTTINEITNDERTKLSGIAEGAEVNVQANWDETDSNSDAFIQNKPTIPTIPNIPDQFTDLSDTPSSITADQFVRGNSAGDELEFTTINEITNDERTKLSGIAEGAEVNVQADWDETDSNSDAFIQNKPTLPTVPPVPDEFTDLSDTPASITANQFLRGNAQGDGLEFANVVPTQTGSTTFAGLTDTPSTITANQFVRGDSTGNALEFTTIQEITDNERNKLSGIAEGAEVNVQANWDETDTASDAFIENKPTIPTAFTALTDTPSSLGTAGQIVSVNSQEDGLEFITSAAGQELGDYRFDNTIEITSNVTITAENAATYNLKIWLISRGSRTITINEGSGLTFFGVYVRLLNTTGTLIPQSGTNVRINNTTDSTVLDARQSATYFAITANRYQEVYNNFRPEDFLALSDTPSSYGTSGQLVAVNSATDALEFVDPPSTAATTFTALTDTPNSIGNNGQILVANNNVLEFINAPPTGLTVQEDGTMEGAAITTVNFTDNVDVSVTNNIATVSVMGGVSGSAQNWDVQELPMDNIPTNTRRYYVFTGDTARTVTLPSTGIPNGWHIFIANDSETSTVTVNGTFLGMVRNIRIDPTRGREIIYWSSGSRFIEGAERQSIRTEFLEEWEGNPLVRNSDYTNSATGETWNSQTNGVNLDGDIQRNHLINRLVRINIPTGSYVYELPTLSGSSNSLTEVPIGSSFGLINEGAITIILRPRSTNTIITDNISYSFSSPINLATNASITIQRTMGNNWQVVRKVGSFGS